MSLLLDTHIIFWFMTGSSKLSMVHRQQIGNRSQPIFVSAVSGWEISVKVRLGKWPQAAPLLPDLLAKLLAEGFQPLDITLAQAELAGSLPQVH